MRKNHCWKSSAVRDKNRVPRAFLFFVAAEVFINRYGQDCHAAAPLAMTGAVRDKNRMPCAVFIFWIPAFAGMTNLVIYDSVSSLVGWSRSCISVCWVRSSCCLSIIAFNFVGVF